MLNYSQAGIWTKQPWSTCKFHIFWKIKFIKSYIQTTKTLRAQHKMCVFVLDFFARYVIRIVDVELRFTQEQFFQSGFAFSKKATFFGGCFREAVFDILAYRGFESRSAACQAERARMVVWCSAAPGLRSWRSATLYTMLRWQSRSLPQCRQNSKHWNRPDHNQGGWKTWPADITPLA